MIRLAHLSDLHADSAQSTWKLQDWFNKRFTSWINYRFRGRKHRFAAVAEVLECLTAELPRRGIDHIVFSGDATALGFAAEFQRAAQLLRINELSIPGLAVPGNHDYLTPAAAASGDFEKTFAPWQQGRRIGEHRYPFVQRIGPVALIGVNAATGNRIPWDASGEVGAEQLRRLRQLLEESEPGLKVLAIHYPVCLSNRERESPRHGLRDLDAVLEVARTGGVGLWLHGHRHTPYYFQSLPETPFPVICAGSATQQGIWSYGEYTIDGQNLQAVRRTYDPEARCFRDVETYPLLLQ